MYLWYSTDHLFQNDMTIGITVTLQCQTQHKDSYKWKAKLFVINISKQEKATTLGHRGGSAWGHGNSMEL